MDWNNIKKNPLKVDFSREKHIEKEYNKVKYDSYKRIMKYFDKNIIYSFRPNKYPYHLENSLNHYILWFNPYFIFHNHFLANYIVKTNLPKDTDFVIWRNPLIKRSIPSIPHYHVIWKYKSKI